jgi:hypothetical protein
MHVLIVNFNLKGVDERGTWRCATRSRRRSRRCRAS